MTITKIRNREPMPRFQYRKRYEVTCDVRIDGSNPVNYFAFQYRKRYEVTCDVLALAFLTAVLLGFNTASGMRSHVTKHYLLLPLYL